MSDETSFTKRTPETGMGKLNPEPADIVVTGVNQKKEIEVPEIKVVDPERDFLNTHAWDYEITSRLYDVASAAYLQRKQPSEKNLKALDKAFSKLFVTEG